MSGETALRRGSGTKAAWGIRALGVFWFVAAGIAAVAGASLVWPAAGLARIWKLNPRAYGELAPHARLAGAGFLALAGVLLGAAWGWRERRAWGWKLGAGILGVQVCGDVVNVAMGRVWEGAVGAAIGGVVLWYAARAEVRKEFA